MSRARPTAGPEGTSEHAAASDDRLVLGRRHGATGKALLLTVLGEFVLRRGGCAWTKTLVELLSTVEVGEQNARQAVARLAEQGLLSGERVGRQVQWHLSDAGRELLRVGTARIFGFLDPIGPWDGRWVIVTFSVSEDQRAARHRLRKRLGFAGFGFPSAGVAVCAHADREHMAVETLKDLGVDSAAMIFRGEAGDLAGDVELARRAWNLESLGDRYEEFIDQFATVKPACGRDVAGCLTHLVHEWRRFPFLDPELPAVLLPEGWPAREAKELFDQRHAAWLPVARSWVEEVESATTAG